MRIKTRKKYQAKIVDEQKNIYNIKNYAKFKKLNFLCIKTYVNLRFYC
jgi:hypothetical protein